MVKNELVETIIKNSINRIDIISEDSVFSRIADSLNKIGEGIGSFADFCGKAATIFKSATYWLVHPVEFVNVYMTYIMVAAIILLVLKKLGFNTGKWLSLVIIAMLIALAC